MGHNNAGTFGRTFVIPPLSAEVVKAKASRRGRTSKARGKRFERSVAEDVAAALGLPESDIVRARSGKDEVDIGLSKEAKRRFPYWLECKDHKTLKIPEWIKQAEEASSRAVTRGEAPGFPVVVFKTHRDSTKRVVMNFDLFLYLATSVSYEEEP